MAPTAMTITREGSENACVAIHDGLAATYLQTEVQTRKETLTYSYPIYLDQRTPASYQILMIVSEDHVCYINKCTGHYSHC